MSRNMFDSSEGTQCPRDIEHGDSVGLEFEDFSSAGEHTKGQNDNNGSRASIAERQRRNAEIAHQAILEAQRLVSERTEAQANDKSITMVGNIDKSSNASTSPQMPPSYENGGNNKRVPTSHDVTSLETPNKSQQTTQSSSAPPQEEFFVIPVDKNPHVYVTGLPLVRFFFKFLFFLYC